MVRHREFNLDEYILEVCSESGINPDADVFRGTDFGTAGYSISYLNLLKSITILNRDPAFSSRAKKIMGSQNEFYKFLESGKVSDGVVPKSLLVEYCNFIELIFKRGQFIADLSLSRKLQADVKIAASSDLPVFISGESGTGKELTAQTIHKLSDRIKGPFIAVNCAQYAKSALLDSILFGYVEGSHNQAKTDKDGLLKTADGGTLFLDEIGDADQATQTLLLRYLNENEFYPLGGLTPEKSDVRVICATNKFDMSKVKAGQANLRSDLYFRVAQQHISMAPLRNHKASIPLIAYLLTEKIRRELNFRNKVEFPLIFTYTLLRYYKFPGNYRELVGFIEDWVRKYIYWKQNYREDFSVLNFTLNPKIERAKKYSRISQKNLELINMAGFIDDVDRIPNVLMTRHYHDRFLEFPYLQWALFNYEKQKPMKKSSKIEPEYLGIYSYEDYPIFTTIKPPVSADVSSILDAMFYKDDKLKKPLKELIDEGISRIELVQLYYNEFLRVRSFKSRNDFAHQLGFYKDKNLKKFLKDYDLKWPEWLFEKPKWLT